MRIAAMRILRVVLRGAVVSAGWCSRLVDCVFHRVPPLAGFSAGLLLTFAGQTVVRRFRAATDVSLPTTFRVDDVSVR